MSRLTKKIENSQYSNDYGNCVEFVVSRWGDICTYRVYKNGEITAR